MGCLRQCCTVLYCCPKYDLNEVRGGRARGQESFTRGNARQARYSPCSTARRQELLIRTRARWARTYRPITPVHGTTFPRVRELCRPRTRRKLVSGHLHLARKSQVRSVVGESRDAPVEECSKVIDQQFCTVLCASCGFGVQVYRSSRAKMSLNTGETTTRLSLMV